MMQIRAGPAQQRRTCSMVARLSQTSPAMMTVSSRYAVSDRLSHLRRDQVDGRNKNSREGMGEGKGGARRTDGAPVQVLCVIGMQV